jgi:hypothetical protein
LRQGAREEDLDVAVDDTHAVAVRRHYNDVAHHLGRVALRVVAPVTLDHVPQIAALAELRA